MENGQATSQMLEPGKATAPENITEQYRSMVLDLICYLRNMPHAEGEPRQRFDAVVTKLRNTDDVEEVLELSRQLAVVCNSMGAITDTLVEKTLREHHAGVKKIIGSVTESIRSLSTSNESLQENIDQEISKIVNLDESDPKAAGEVLLSVSNSLSEATRKVKAEIVDAKTEVENTSGRVKELEQQLEQTRQESLRDALTRLYNRRAFNVMLEETLSGSGIKGTWCMIMLDIDHFKLVNDTHGHLIGDALLVKVARILDAVVDGSSFAARYGGEEFSIIVANAEIYKAVEVAEEIRARVAAGKWSYSRGRENRTLSATVSMGVAEYRPEDTAESIVGRADQALYYAKKHGRDQVRTESDLEE